MKRDGLTLYYQDLGERDAPALVLVHGLGCDSTIWREQLTDFSRDHRVRAVDLPGFGQSDKPHDRDYSLAWFAQTLQWVLEDAKVERPVLVGHSMGFAIVRRHCLDYPGVAAALCDVDGFCFRNPMQAQLYTVWKQIVDFIQWPFVTVYRIHILREDSGTPSGRNSPSGGADRPACSAILLGEHVRLMAVGSGEY